MQPRDLKLFLPQKFVNVLHMSAPNEKIRNLELFSLTNNPILLSAAAANPHSAGWPLLDFHRLPAFVFPTV